jgi:hypothetical protein
MTVSGGFLHSKLSFCLLSQEMKQKAAWLNWGWDPVPRAGTGGPCELAVNLGSAFLLYEAEASLGSPGLVWALGTILAGNCFSDESRMSRGREKVKLQNFLPVILTTPQRKQVWLTNFISAEEGLGEAACCCWPVLGFWLPALLWAHMLGSLFGSHGRRKLVLFHPTSFPHRFRYPFLSF